ncbi:DUF1289 domain-containing protein [Rhodopirellula bahusiensis]|uniref:DUF1289 domain-containing protein n=1 Tax=Rhodopirellula bahusiensis TaxID=2014065 RepID=A0A2G1W685_9BACT|nr:DUF1289 domain-containing protein [Rhodopirellula bahusiensis]PHQ34553.1 DUF1289 domain-containing protein [Rhodopirellula bahusiensis]
MTRPIDTPQSPCIGVCQVNQQQLCVGCFRTLGEIGRWSIASPAEKRSILGLVRQRRAAQAPPVQTVPSEPES